MIMAITDEWRFRKPAPRYRTSAGPASGNHSWVVKKLPVLFWKAGIAFHQEGPDRGHDDQDEDPAPRVRLVKIRSPARTERPRTLGRCVRGLQVSTHPLCVDSSGQRVDSVGDLVSSSPGSGT